MLHRLRDLHRKYEAGLKVKTDKYLGEKIIAELQMGEDPWKLHAMNEVIDESGDTPDTRQVSSPSSTFGGNFSILIAASSSFKIGIGNSSHCAWDKQIWHLGTFCRVEVPVDCILNSHALLFHYGDRAQMMGKLFNPSIRLFVYCADSRYKIPTLPETHHVLPERFCVGCNQCDNVKSQIKEDKCGNTSPLVWKCKHSPDVIANTEPGGV